MQSTGTQRIGLRIAGVAWIAVGLVVSAGCGSKSKPAAAEADEPASKAVEKTSADSGSTKTASSKTSKKPAGPSIDGIPLDVVWFDEPLAVVADRTPLGMPATESGKTAAPPATATAESFPKPEATPTPAAGAGGSYADLITPEAIVKETKDIKNRLTDGLSTVGKYNGNYKDNISVDGAVLAALAQVAVSLPDGVSWKAHAPFVRDYAGEVSASAKGLGAGPYDATKKAFDKLDSVLSNNKPDGEAPPSKVPFSEVAGRMPVMKRMQKAFDKMKSNVTAEAIFKKEAEMIAHESAVLAVLAQVVGEKEYNSADEDEYQQFIKEMVVVSKALGNSVKNESYSEFSDSLGKLQKVCNDCHQAYRFE